MLKQFLICVFVTFLYAGCVIATVNPFEPAQIHLSFGPQDSSSAGMWVQWVSHNQTVSPSVQYGTSQAALTMTATGNSTYYYSTTAFQFTNKVLLTGLSYDTLYYYQVGSAANGLSSVFSFTTPPQTVRPFTAAIYGDMGTLYGNVTRAAMVQNLDAYEWVFHLGDIAYSDDMPTKDYSSNYDAFFDQIQPYAAHKAYQVLPGNHDADCHTTGALGCQGKFVNFTVFRTRWTMDGSPSQNMWYSFNYSYATFISISSETDFPHAPEGPDTIYNCGPFGDQMSWVEAQLQAANTWRNERPWIIVTGHRPVYSANTNDFPPNAVENLRRNFEDLFIKYKVDLYLSGHVHGYERTYPMNAGVIMNQTGYNNPGYPTYVVIGNAGNIEGHSTALSSSAPGTPYLVTWNDTDYGYALMSITQNTLSWKALRDYDAAILDQFEITKNN